MLALALHSRRHHSHPHHHQHILRRIPASTQFAVYTFLALAAVPGICVGGGVADPEGGWWTIALEEFVVDGKVEQNPVGQCFLETFQKDYGPNMQPNMIVNDIRAGIAQLKQREKNGANEGAKEPMLTLNPLQTLVAHPDLVKGFQFSQTHTYDKIVVDRVLKFFLWAYIPERNALERQKLFVERAHRQNGWLHANCKGNSSRFDTRKEFDKFNAQLVKRRQKAESKIKGMQAKFDGLMRKCVCQKLLQLGEGGGEEEGDGRK